MTLHTILGFTMSLVFSILVLVTLNVVGMPTDYNIPLSIILGSLGGLITAITEPF